MPVVMLHPIGLDHETWFQMPLDGIPDIVRYDMLGHGERTLDPDGIAGISLAKMADDVAENTTGDLDLVGFSMGGIVALHVAHRHPARVRSLMVMCTARGEPEALEKRAQEIEQLGMAGVVDGMLNRWFSDEALADPDSPAVSYARGRLLADDASLVAAVWRAAKSHDLRAALTTMDLPVTVVAATNDWAGREERGREMVDGLPHARLEFIEGPHMLQLERGPECADLLQDHLAWSGLGT